MHLQARFVIPGAIAILAFTGPLFCQTGDEKGVIAPAVSLKRIVPGGLKPGSVMDCKIERPIFFVDREVLPAGTRVRLVVSEVTENRRPKTGLARRIAALATGSPRPKGSYAITLRSAAIILPNGDAVPAQAQVLGILDQRRLVASGRRGEPRSTVVVRLTHIPDIPVNARPGDT
ncbi:MAG: hypothetical protein M1436_03170, partial [Acidobacteria bacterium]|nr:hypothetical protein [Acidobacteriota bacterium]